MEQRLNAAYLRPALAERALAAGIAAAGIGIGILLATWGISSLWRYSPREIQRLPFPPVITSSADANRANNTAIKRQVTVFSSVKHESGEVVSGWNYQDGNGVVPIRQYCYYDVPHLDHSTTRVDLARDGVRVPSISVAQVPDLKTAIAKCQWWKH
jgi:hypothetical protein